MTDAAADLFTEQKSDQPERKVTTPQLCELLREKYPRNKYALLFDVPDAVSLDQKRRIDALAFSCWRSEGRGLEGFELKVSRSDWLREVKQVDKADPFVALCDRFWLVTADSTIAKSSEIPACWGWMAATKTGLRIQKPAQKLPGSGETFPRSFVIGLMRRLQEDLLESPDVAAHINGKIRAIEQNQEQAIKWATQRTQDDLKRLQDSVADFEKVAGVHIGGWDMGHIGGIVRALRSLRHHGGHGMDAVLETLIGQENTLEILLKQVREARESVAGQVGTTP